MAVELVAVLRLQDEMTSGLKKAAGAATVGFAAITAAAGVSVNKFVEFDNAIRKTGAIAGANATELQALSDMALDLGQSTSKGATEIANSMAELSAGGFAVNDVMSAMPGIIAASEASGESLAVASETVSSALNLWSLEAEKSSHIADVLAQAANMSAAGIQDLGNAFQYAGAPAAALGVSLEETAAAVGILSNNGIDGSSAGTALRASLLALNNPAKEQAKMMDKLGFSVTDAQGNFKTLSGMIGDMQKATEHMTEADKVATLGKLVGTEAVSGFLALMKAGPAEIDKMTEALVNSGGASAETAKQMMGGIGGSLEEMSGAIETAMIKVGEALAPTVVKMADFIAAADFSSIISTTVVLGEKMLEVATFVVDNWDEIISTVKLVGSTILAAGAAVVTFKAIMAGMTIIKTVTALFAAWRAGTLLSTAATLGLNTAMWASPFTWVAAGVAALVGIAVLLALNWDTVTTKTRELWSAIGGLEGAFRLVTGPIGIVIGAAIDLARNWDSTKSVWENVWGAMARSAAATVNSVIGGINSMIKAINSIPGVNIPVIAKVDWGSSNGGSYATQAKVVNSGGAQALGYYHGLNNVPYDGMPARLHKGEAVLTRQEAEAYRSGHSGGSNGSITIAKLADQIIVREDADINRIADGIVAKIMERRGVTV